ncbi:hypothetical protein BDR03DRAFT_1006514 [Suillus americanus]|nr:hypothetical protein BDR03DRAFT_1006514 [Suillus americanus]
MHPSAPAPVVTAVPSFSFGPTLAQLLFAAPLIPSLRVRHQARKPANWHHSPSQNQVNGVPASAPSAHVPLKFDFGKKSASTTPRPTAISPPTAAAADAAKQTSPLFVFSVATSQSSPLGASSPQKFPLDRLAHRVETETEMPKFSFGSLSSGSVSGFTDASSAPKSMPSFGAPSGTSAFATGLLSGGDATKTDKP